MIMFVNMVAVRILCGEHDCSACAKHTASDRDCGEHGRNHGEYVHDSGGRAHNYGKHAHSSGEHVRTSDQRHHVWGGHDFG